MKVKELIKLLNRCAEDFEIFLISDNDYTITGRYKIYTDEQVVEMEIE